MERPASSGPAAKISADNQKRELRGLGRGREIWGWEASQEGDRTNATLVYLDVLPRLSRRGTRPEGSEEVPIGR